MSLANTPAIQHYNIQEVDMCQGQQMCMSEGGQCGDLLWMLEQYAKLNAE